jgi:hypothetical protein
LAALPADLPALIALLHEAEVLGPRGPSLSAAALPAGSSRATQTPRARFEAAMEALRDSHPAAFDARREELAYLTNVLLAGTPDRPLRPVEALELAIEHCSRGLQRELKKKTSRAAAAQALLHLPADVLFRLGFSSTSTSRSIPHSKSQRAQRVP